jgi:parallel beta-helix repeat protein
MKKGIVLGIVFLFVFMSFTSISGVQINNQIIKSSGKGDIFYVGGSGPGNYSRIQDAIDNASEGDTILVFSGTYNEYIRVDKQLFMKGIRKNGEEIPTINGGDDHDTVIMYADGCSFENFKVRNDFQGGPRIGITLQSDNNFISNCTSFNTDTSLYMISSSHNVIFNNHMYRGDRGIRLKNSSNNTLFENNLYSHVLYEVLLEDNSRNNKFYNNIIASSDFSYGVEVKDSSDNLFDRNIISTPGDPSIRCRDRGIWLRSSINITIIENTFIENGISISGSLINWNTHTIENNTANDKPIYYYKNMNSIIVPNDATQVILANCKNFKMENMDISGVDTGVCLAYSSHNIIKRSNISSSYQDGIFVFHSSNNTLTGNTLKKNLNGINLQSSDNNTIADNIIQNHDIGIKIYKSPHNIVSNNSILKSRVGIFQYAKGSDNNIILENRVISNSDYGIQLWGGSNNMISNNIVSSSTFKGINIKGAGSNLSVLGNTVTENDQGIKVSGNGYKNIIISENIVSDNDQGITISSCSNSVVSFNNVTNNNKGIIVASCTNIVVSSNNVTNNEYGVKISIGHSSGNVNIEKNNFMENNLNAFATFLSEGFLSIFFVIKNSFTNHWRKNYWDDWSGSGPKRIEAEFVIEYSNPFDPWSPPSRKTYSWVKFDFFPAKEPYDI